MSSDSTILPDDIRIVVREVNEMMQKAKATHGVRGGEHGGEFAQYRSLNCARSGT